MKMEERLQRLRQDGVIDMHFDLPMDLFERRQRTNILAQDFLADFEAGDIRLVTAAIYLENKYVPARSLPVALGQIAKLLQEIDANDRITLCRSFAEIENAREKKQIGFLLSLEGVEPLGNNLAFLRVFYELGLRLVGLTHVRVNAAARGAIFEPSNSPSEGLTDFGRELFHECERLGVIVDLAHLNPAGFDEIVGLATRPPIVSHTNARRYFDIERNLSDDQARAVAQLGGVIGVNAILVSPSAENATLDRFVDHLEHFIELTGIDHVALGFDFIEFTQRGWSRAKKSRFHQKFPRANSIPDLTHHGHASNLTRKLIARGFEDDAIEKILRGNWLRILKMLL